MPKQGTSKAHSDAPGDEAVAQTKRNLGWPDDKFFFVPKEALAVFRSAVKNGAKQEKEWNDMVRKYEKANPEIGADFRAIRSDTLPADWEKSLPKFDGVESKATRAYSGEVINAIADALPQLIGGSGDLSPSDKSTINTSSNFEMVRIVTLYSYHGCPSLTLRVTLNGDKTTL